MENKTEYIELTKILNEINDKLGLISKNTFNTSKNTFKWEIKIPVLKNDKFKMEKFIENKKENNVNTNNLDIDIEGVDLF